MKKFFALLASLLIISGMVFAQEAEWQTEERQTTQEQTEQRQTEQRQTEQRQTTQEQTEQRQTEQSQAEQRQRKERQIEFFNLEFSLGFPVHFTNGIDSNGTTNLDKIFNGNTAFGLTTTFNFTDRVGLTLDMDIFYGARLQGLSTDNSNFISLFGANVILGPVFNVVNVDRLRIPLGFGIHMFYFSDKFWNPTLGNTGDWVGRNDLQLGLATSLAIQYHFDSNIYIFSRTNVMLDVVRMVTTENSIGASDDMFIIEFNWGIKPSIGIGLRIN